MYLLDTNIISMLDARRQAKAPALVAWMRRNGASLYLSVMTITELDAGVLKLRRNAKSARADEIASLINAILSDFGDRVLETDLATARHLARLGEVTHKRPLDLPDLIIAATAARHGLHILSRNTKHLSRLGLPVSDPFVQLPPDV